MASLPSVSDLFSRTGSFWTRNYGDKVQARALVAAAAEAAFWHRAREGGENLALAPRIPARNRRIRFIADSVVETTSPAFAAEAPWADAAKKTRFPWAVRTGNTEPLALLTKEGKLLAGNGFFWKDSWLLLPSHPRALFGGAGWAAAPEAREPLVSVLNYPAGVSGAGEGIGHIIHYLRNARGPESLKKALCALAGLPVLGRGGRLLQVRESAGETVYVFESETLRAWWPHQPLEEEEYYPAGTVPGEPVRVLYPGPGRWWRPAFYGSGVALEGSLRAEDAPVPAWTVSSDPGSADGSKAHLRIRLAGDEGEADAFWDRVHAAETASGIYLNSAAGLAEPGDSGSETMLNAADFFFEVFFRHRAVVISVDPQAVPDEGPLREFVRDNLPIGRIPVWTNP